jgi:hypothetical protein
MIRLSDPDAFERIASVECAEGPGWAERDRRGGAYSMTGMLRAWAEFQKQKDAWDLGDVFDATIFDHSGVISEHAPSQVECEAHGGFIVALADEVGKDRLLVGVHRDVTVLVATFDRIVLRDVGLLLLHERPRFIDLDEVGPQAHEQLVVQPRVPLAHVAAQAHDRVVVGLQNPCRGPDRLTFAKRSNRRDTLGKGEYIHRIKYTPWQPIPKAQQFVQFLRGNQAKRLKLAQYRQIPQNQYPRLVVVSDFARFRVLDLDPETRAQIDEVEFPIEELPRELDRFMFLAGYEQRVFKQEDAVNVEAAALLGKVYEDLEAADYTGHDLQVFAVRLIFVLFADDSLLWERNQFTRYLQDRTAEDGHDLGMHLVRLFEVLNTPDNRRSRALDEDLAAFPYVNGGLFEERVSTPDCKRKMREHLLEASAFDWSQISPAIFGSIFQSVMDPEERREFGAHYTREKNIRRVIEPLFLDELRADLDSCGQSRQRLRNLHDRIAKIKCLDPAMGCGNFLIIAYQELRRIETEILTRLHPSDVQLTIDLSGWRKVRPDNFCGIEIEEFPARIAQTAMYLVDHIENERLGRAFGKNIVDLPLAATANVRIANALRIDWNTVLPAEQCTYLFGNPPFAGQKTRRVDQTEDLRLVWGSAYARWLDYVTGWYRKACDYVRDSEIQCAFVSTNSVTQGEQVARLWGPLLQSGLRIDFGHRTFRWSSEAKKAAHVHCVIVGFSVGGRRKSKVLYEYDHIDAEPAARVVKEINPYLVAADTVLVEDRSTPLSPHMPPVNYGNKPTDGGHLVVEDCDRPSHDPIAMKYLRRYVGAKELLHDLPRWCLWLLDADPNDLARSSFIRNRVSKVRKFRSESTAPDTKKYASQPARFFRIPQPSVPYIAIPRHVSETRQWFTVAHFPPTVIASDALFTAVDPDGLVFGILSSAMFMAWLRTVGGALKSDLRFSGLMVYNTFPLPELSETQRAAVVAAGNGVLAARSQFPNVPLANLYDPLGMPNSLVEAHRKLDRVVDQLFKDRGGFKSDSERLAALFERYVSLVASARPPVGSTGKEAQRGRGRRKAPVRANGGENE